MNEFVAYIISDQLTELPAVSAKAMFGGYGLYVEGTIVGIVSDDELYLKADETNMATYTAMGSVPFTYAKKDGKTLSMSYWKVSADALEDREQLRTLVLDSYEINLRKALRKKPLMKKK